MWGSTIGIRIRSISEPIDPGSDRETISDPEAGSDQEGTTPASTCRFDPYRSGTFLPNYTTRSSGVDRLTSNVSPDSLRLYTGVSGETRETRSVFGDYTDRSSIITR